MTPSKSDGRYFSTQGSDSEPSLCFWLTLSILCFIPNEEFSYLSSTSMEFKVENCLFQNEGYNKAACERKQG